MPARPRPRAPPPPQPLSLPEFEPALPPLPSSPPLENQATPSSASSSSSSSSTSFISIPPVQHRPSFPSSASYDSTRSADDEPTPWGGRGGGSVSSASSPPPPLRGLASKFASMMGRAQPSTGGDEGVQSSLSSDEIVRLAIEERDRSRREAERVLAREEQQEGRGGGTIKASKTSKKERGPFFDATQSPSPRPSPNNNTTNLNPLDPQTPTRSKSSTSQLTPGPLHPSPYLIPRDPSSSDGIDVEASLALLANRFTKLEAWTVGHVRALEEKVDKMEGRVRVVEERGGEVGKLGRDLTELKGAMRAGFEAMEAQVLTTPPPPSAPPAPVATTRASSLERVKEERPPPFDAVSTPPLVTKRSVLSPPVASTTPTPTPSSSSKPRTFAPVTTTAPLRTSHRSTVSISSIPHPASTQSFTTTTTSSPRTPHSTSPLPTSTSSFPKSTTISTTNILHTPTLTVPRSTSPLPSSNSAPTSPGAPPPRKRYTTALGERASSSSTTNLPLLNLPSASASSSSLPLEQSENGSGTPRSTPLPSSPFTKPTRSATGLLGGGGGGAGGSKVGRRRSRSVGGHDGSAKEEEMLVKASNLKRAQVGSLIGFWDKS